MRSHLFLFCFILLLFTGCYSKPVRHLASDATLIKPGQSTVQDMLKYLGEPDGRREISPGVNEYIYHADRPGFLGTMPVVGSMTGSSGYEMIVVLVENDIVTHCEFRNFNKSDRRWMNDHTWKEIE